MKLLILSALLAQIPVGPTTDGDSPFAVAQQMNVNVNAALVKVNTDFGAANASLVLVRAHYDRVSAGMIQGDKDNYQIFLNLSYAANLQSALELHHGRVQLSIAAKYLEAARLALTAGEQNRLATIAMGHYTKSATHLATSDVAALLSSSYAEYIDTSILSSYGQ